jgi:hypothetical protein
MTETVEEQDAIRRRPLVRALQRARYHPLLSSILYGVGRPVRALTESAGRQIARKVRLNGER